MKKILFFLSIYFSIPFIFAQNSWDWKTSNIEFKIKNAGFNVTGTLKGLEAKINFNDGDKNDVIEASVKTATINTNNNARDRHLKRADYFDAEKYPTIQLKSTSFSKISNEKFNGFFKLTIKNVTKTIEMPFTFKKNGKNGSFEGSFVINRLDYGVGESSWVLGNNVTIKINIQVVQ
ncbi:MAG: YceI family protein [Cytophagia bacterium]|nr:MAG: YceI family protein [Cytophagia bacterium]